MTDENPDKKTDPTAGEKLKVNLIVGGVIAAVVLLLIVVPKWGYRSPCAWLGRKEYERQFFVYLFPNRGETKAYRVPARIWAYVTESGDDVERVYAILYAERRDCRL
jgi:hypothetical protein